MFKYIDTASSRAGIGAVNVKLKGQRICIVGLGGSGTYILDLVGTYILDLVVVAVDAPQLA